jgi:tetratricopeptide (TPR) repeat protein
VAERDDVAWLVYGNLASIAGISAICGDGLLSFPFQLPAPTLFFFVQLAFIGASWAMIRGIVEPDAAVDGAVVAPRAQPVLPGIKIMLALAAISAVWFVHYENPRLLEAERGFTNGRRLQRRNPAAGLTEIRKAVALNPDDFQNHFIEALCHNSMRNMPEAIASIERSLALYPNLLNAWVNLALFAKKGGEQAKMLHAVDTALALKPDETYVLDIKSDYLASLGRHGDVVAMYKPWIASLNADWKMGNRRYLSKYVKSLRATRQWALLGATYEQMIRYYVVKPWGIKERNWPAAKRRKKERRFLADRLKYWGLGADAYHKAGMYKDELRLLQLAGGYVKHSNGDIKRRYALALVRNKLWQRAWHETGVALDVDRSQKTAILQALGEARIQGTEKKVAKVESAGGWPALDDAGLKELDRLIARVQTW